MPTEWWRPIWRFTTRLLRSIGVAGRCVLRTIPGTEPWGKPTPNPAERAQRSGDRLGAGSRAHVKLPRPQARGLLTLIVPRASFSGCRRLGQVPGTQGRRCVLSSSSLGRCWAPEPGRLVEWALQGSCSRAAKGSCRGLIVRQLARLPG